MFHSGDWNYTNDTLKFINHEEGHVVIEANGTPTYQYNLIDHLGNVRLTFTTQTTTDERTAGFETANQSTEAEKFENYPSGGGLINTQSTNAHTGTNSLYLNGGYAGQVGVAKSYSVMPGDVLQIEAYVKYNTPSGTGNDLSAFATSLLSAFNLSAPVPGETGTASSAINSWGALAAGGYANGTTNTDPKLFVTILIFDSEHNFKDVAYQQVSSSGALISASYTVKEPGYAYLYVSNEHPTFADAYFDDVKMTLTPSVVVALNDYYPFGLTFNSYQRENSVDQRFKFQSQEHIDELDLGWDSFKWRNHMPDIGRFFGIDPLAEKYYYNSPYAFSENKVVAHRELEGLESVEAGKREILREAKNEWDAFVNKVEKTFDKVIDAITPDKQIGPTDIEKKNQTPIPVNEDQKDAGVVKTNAPSDLDGNTNPQYNPKATAKGGKGGDKVVMQEGGQTKVENADKNVPILPIDTVWVDDSGTKGTGKNDSYYIMQGDVKLDSAFFVDKKEKKKQ